MDIITAEIIYFYVTRYINTINKLKHKPARNQMCLFDSKVDKGTHIPHTIMSLLFTRFVNRNIIHG